MKRRIKVILYVIRDSLPQIPNEITLIPISILVYLLFGYVFMDGGKSIIQWFPTINYVPSGIILCGTTVYLYRNFAQQFLYRSIFQVMTIALMIWIIQTFKFPSYAVGSVLDLYEVEYAIVKTLYILVFLFWSCWFLISVITKALQTSVHEQPDSS